MPSTQSGAIRHPDLPGLPLLYRGKVRDSYAAGDDRLLLVASDRLSAFDCILPDGVPDKGRVLTALSAFWFERTRQLLPNHLISADWPEIAQAVGLDRDIPDLDGRAMLVHRAQRIDVECVMRGYLAGSGWAEYQAHGTLAGVPLPEGLIESAELPEPAFTPALKNDAGHDENVSVAHLTSVLGQDLAAQLERASRDLYTFARQYARTRGMLIADTKFEFGLMDGGLMLIDEVLTPDSSRFWAVDRYHPGGPQESFDKQPVRDYLAARGWRGTQPAPTLPQPVIDATSDRYRSAYAMLTGQTLDD